MLVDAMKRLAERLGNSVEEHEVGDPFFSDPSYKTFPISKERFRRIESVQSGRRLTFVDGGNQEILGAPNFSVQFNRVYFCIFSQQQRIFEDRLPSPLEFLSLTHSTFKEGEIIYETQLVSIEDNYKELLPIESDLSFNSFDRTVTVGTQRADIERVASIARRFAEWNYAFNVVEKSLNEGDVLVVDGTLQTSFTNELKYAKKLYAAARSKGVIVTGISKTSRLFTTTGMSLLGAVRRVADEAKICGAWFIPIAEVQTSDHNAFIFVVKMNPIADYVFRFEIDHEQFEQLGFEGVNEILSLLADNSRDISFPGYPYGLVDADRFARVAETEAAIYKALLLSEISKIGKWPKLLGHIQAIDAHDILNMLIG